jgi:hypothetical protein
MSVAVLAGICMAASSTAALAQSASPTGSGPGTAVPAGPSVPLGVNQNPNPTAGDPTPTVRNPNPAPNTGNPTPVVADPNVKRPYLDPTAPKPNPVDGTPKAAHPKHPKGARDNSKPAVKKIPLKVPAANGATDPSATGAGATQGANNMNASPLNAPGSPNAGAQPLTP